MKSFFVLFSLFLKSRIFNRSFLSICLAMLLLITGFAILAPDSASPSAKVGIIFENSDQSLYQSCCYLLNLQEMDFIRYHDEQLLRRDVMSGKLHCGYKLDPIAETPITVFETAGSMLTPVLDELVFSAWFESHMLDSTPELYGSNYSSFIASEIERLGLQSRPLAIDIKINTLSSGKNTDAFSLESVLYSVFVPLILLSATFCALLSPESEKDTLGLLFSNGSRKIGTAFFSAQAVCFFAVTLAFELMMSLLSISNSFTFAARILSVLLLAAASAAIFCLFLKTKPNTFILFFAVVWAAVSIVFSGAFVSPVIFGSFEPIKYLSPSWLLLRLMTALTAI